MFHSYASETVPPTFNVINGFSYDLVVKKESEIIVKMRISNITLEKYTCKLMLHEEVYLTYVLEIIIVVNLTNSLTIIIVCYVSLI